MYAYDFLKNFIYEIPEEKKIFWWDQWNNLRAERSLLPIEYRKLNLPEWLTICFYVPNLSIFRNYVIIITFVYFCLEKNQSNNYSQCLEISTIHSYPKLLPSYHSIYRSAYDDGYPINRVPLVFLVLSIILFTNSLYLCRWSMKLTLFLSKAFDKRPWCC